MPFEDPFDVQNPTDDDDILAAYGDVLRNNDMVLRSPARVRVHRNTPLGIPNEPSPNATVTFDGELFDSAGIHATSGSETDRLVIPAGWDGEWHVSARVRWDSLAAGTRRYAEIIYVTPDNNEFKCDDDESSPSTTGWATNKVSALWPAAAGGYFTLRVYHEAGVSLNIVADPYAGTHMEAFFVGAGETP